MEAWEMNSMIKSLSDTESILLSDTFAKDRISLVYSLFSG